MFVKQVGIDLGTSNIRVYVRGRGVVLNEPTVVAHSATDDRVRGRRHAKPARWRSGRPPRIVISAPDARGVIADYGVTAPCCATSCASVGGRISLSRPTVMICIPAA